MGVCYYNPHFTEEKLRHKGIHLPRITKLVTNKSSDTNLGPLLPPSPSIVRRGPHYLAPHTAAITETLIQEEVGPGTRPGKPADIRRWRDRSCISGLGSAGATGTPKGPRFTLLILSPHWGCWIHSQGPRQNFYVHRGSSGHVNLRNTISGILSLGGVVDTRDWMLGIQLCAC